MPFWPPERQGMAGLRCGRGVTFGYYSTSVVVTLKPDSPVGPSSCMSPLKSPTQVRTELSALIAEAVVEPDDARRHGLLVLADHWSDILRRRKNADERIYHA